MTALDQLLADHAILIQKIIAEAKREATSPVQKIDLFSHISSSFSNLIKDKKDKNIISGYIHPLKWTRNINCWASSLDLTGMSVGIFGLGGVGGGSLITRKHVLLANHVPYPALPATIYFVDKNSNSYEYKIIKTKRVATSDILIGELDKEVDNSLKIYKVLPADFAKYLPIQPMTGQPRFPVAFSDQEKKMLMGDYMSTFNNGTTEKVSHISPPNDSDRLNYFEQLIVGDSGNPVSTIINNELVLLGGWYQTLSAQGGWSTPIPAYINEVNNTIASLTNGYKVNEVDLSGFNIIS